MPGEIGARKGSQNIVFDGGHHGEAALAAGDFHRSSHEVKVDRKAAQAAGPIARIEN
jgi:hypothetical protein